jgi:hypothetical protein
MDIQIALPEAVDEESSRVARVFPFGTVGNGAMDNDEPSGRT